MIISTKCAVGEQVIFKYGPNDVETPGVVAMISATVSKHGKVNVKYWVAYAGCCGVWVKENRIIQK